MRDGLLERALPMARGRDNNGCQEVEATIITVITVITVVMVVI
jgi:hypothetical protein